jgi:hypothetical protein
MTLAEKVNQSADGTLFTLHKEGLLYKCYNEDAMVFVQKSGYTYQIKSSKDDSTKAN